MSLLTILRAALHRWYITIPGVLLSFIIASTVFSSMPPKYTSTGIAVLVRPDNPTPTSSINPVLGSDGTFTNTTMTLVQALDTPAVREALGLGEGGVDNFTITNVIPGKAAAGGDHPFIYVTAQSSNAQKSTEIVVDIITVARQKLTDLQNDSHVRPQNQIKLESVVNATPPKAVMYIVFAVAGAVLTLCIVATCIVACVWDIIAVARQRRHMHRSMSRAKEHADSRVRAST